MEGQLTRLALRELDALSLDLRSTKVAAIGDETGELTAAIAALSPLELRVHNDEVTFQQERHPAAPQGIAGSTAGRTQTFLDLIPELVTGIDLVILVLPKSLSALQEISELVARVGVDGCTVLAVGRVKYMSPAQNEILARSFREVWATRGLGKCRALVARDPLPTARTAAPTFPLTSILREPELTAAIGRDQLVLVSHGGVFAGGKLDIGTRALLTTAEQWPAAEGIVDLGCGTGILATVAALRNPDATVIATDRSSAAVRSAAATAAANGLSVPAIVHADVVFPGNWAENDTNVHARRDRVGSDVCARRDQVGARGVVAIQADAGAGIPDQSQDLVLLNPPFHDRTAISTDAAHAMFAAAARMLKPGGELWVVWNSHLRYRPALERTVGPTDQILRTSKFTVTRSRRAPAAR